MSKPSLYEIIFIPTTKTESVTYILPFDSVKAVDEFVDESRPKYGGTEKCRVFITWQKWLETPAV